MDNQKRKPLALTAGRKLKKLFPILYLCFGSFCYCYERRKHCMLFSSVIFADENHTISSAKNVANSTEAALHQNQFLIHLMEPMFCPVG